MRLLAGFVFAGFGLLVCRAAEPPPEEGFLLGGIQVNEPDPGHWIRSLQREGFNAVALTVYAHQGNWDSAHLWFDEDAEWVRREARAAKDAGLRVVLILRIALDHARERNRFLWHGMIMPTSDEELDAWFARYGTFVEIWARIAEAEGIDVLGIASELNALTSTVSIDELPELEAFYLDAAKQEAYAKRVQSFGARIDRRHLKGSWKETYDSLPRYLSDRTEALRGWAGEVTGLRQGVSVETAVAGLNRRRRLLQEEWTALIRRVRRIYSGRVTYAANFDQYASVGFWRELDLMGINAYFPLRRHPVSEAGVATLEGVLEASWRGILERIDRVREDAGVGSQPVLFTELGYTARLDSTIEPWSAEGFSLVGDWENPELVVWDERAPNVEERALAVRALHRASEAVDPGMLSGLLYWKLSTVKEHSRIEPFVVILGDPAGSPGGEDPMLRELRRFRPGFSGRRPRPTSRR